MIHIYDGNNYFRKVLETDITGLAPRTMLDKFQHVTEPTVWVWDGEKANARRRAIYPEYKRNRTPLKKDIFAGFETMQEVFCHTGVIQVKVPGYEADDVIASLARHYANGNESVAVYSNDADFLQLSAEFPNHIFTGANRKEHIPPTLIRLYKTCVGDASDNIPGIGGFGDQSWKTTDKSALQALVDAIVERKPVPDVDLPKRCKTWLSDNSELIASFWKIIGFIPVPLPLISENMTVGQPNYAEADAYLRRFFL